MVYAFTPHSHKRGVSANVSIRYPDGTEKTLLAMPRYDFNWQWDYVLAKPLNVPAGSKIITHWVYDNSARNPGNTSIPTKIGRLLGRAVLLEEMPGGSTYPLPLGRRETAKNPHDELRDEAEVQANLMLDVMDDNMKDGKLEYSEELKGGPRRAPARCSRKYFNVIDTDHDGSIDAKELAAAMKMLPQRGRGAAKAAAGAAPGAPSMPATTPAVVSDASKAAPAGGGR